MGNTNIQEAVRRNPVIEAVLANGQLAIEFQAGMQYLNQYLSDLAMLSAGAPYSSLGISARRHLDVARVVNIDAAGKMSTFTDRGLIYNSSLTPANSYAIIPVIGFMQTEGSGGSGSPRGMRGFAADIRAAYANPNILGVLLDINSGGGEVMAMEVMNDALSVRNKPVVAHALLAASAAYGTAAGADEIIALSESTRVGSIGAVLTLNKIALQEYADQYLDIYGKNAPNKNREFRAMQAGDFSAIQSVVDDATDMFQAKVRKMRQLKGAESKIQETLSGDMYTSGEARKRGLIDGVGGIEYALKRLESWVKRYQA